MRSVKSEMKFVFIQNSALRLRRRAQSFEEKVGNFSCCLFYYLLSFFHQTKAERESEEKGTLKSALMTVEQNFDL
jgi:hypothetical protein